MIYITRLTAVLAGLGLFATTFGQTFFNASFEQPDVGTGGWAPRPDGWGWGGMYNAGIANGNGSWGTGAHSGNQYAFVESDGIDFPGQQAWMEQTVSGFTIGQQYAVTFWMARRNGDVGGNVSNPMLVLLNHQDVIFNPTYANSEDWTQYSTSVFTAHQTSNTFTFETIQTFVDSANLFDDMAIVEPVPEPATLAVVGFGTLILLRRRQKR